MRTLICADTECMKDPSLIGLSRTDLIEPDVQFATNGEDARQLARALDAHDQVLVVSSDDIEPINLAAAIKKDRADVRVELVASNPSGSLYSRAEAAGINSVAGCLSLDEDDFDIDDGIVPFSRNDKCWIMSVFSGSGGTGKTIVSVMAALLLSALDKKVLLLDCDFQLGNVADGFPENEVLAAEDLVADLSLLDKYEGKLCVVRAPKSIEQADYLLANLKDIASRAADSFDVIICNTGANWSDAHAFLLQNSDRSLFLVDQRVSSVRGLKKVLELCEKLNLSNLNFIYALNRCSRKAALRAVDVEDALGVNKCFEIKDGSIKVEELFSAGCANELVREKSPVAVSVFEILKEVYQF